MNDSQGFIALPRDIMNHWLWLDARKLQMWLAMVMMAQFQDRREIVVGNIAVEVFRGQLVVSVRKLAQRLECSKTTVLTFLRVLESSGMIRRQNMYKISIITIVDYEKYAGGGKQESKPEPTAQETPAADNGADNKKPKNRFRFIAPKKPKRDREKSAKNDAKKAGDSDRSLVHNKRITNNTIPPYNPPKGESTHTNAHTREGGEEKFEERLKSDGMAMEALAVTFQTETKILGELAARFAAEQLASGKRHADYGDYKKHFINWARYQVRQMQADEKKQQPTKTRNYGIDNRHGAHAAPNYEDRLRDRRGTEPPGAGKADYDAPL